jgi:hypothetical protein
LWHAKPSLALIFLNSNSGADKQEAEAWGAADAALYIASEAFSKLLQNLSSALAEEDSHTWKARQ